jgi:hypothetical protein
MHLTGVPPLTHPSVGIAIRIDEGQGSAATDPCRNRGMDVRRERLHPFVRHHKQSELIEVLRQGYVFELHRLDGDPSLHKRQGEPVHLAHFVVAAGRATALKHE